jgi:hypothetical protein
MMRSLGRSIPARASRHPHFLLGALAVCIALGTLAPSIAQAALAVQPGSFTVVPTSDQAGAHPNLTTSFAFAADEAGAVNGLLRNAEVVLPLGFAGYPAAEKTCDPVQLQLGKCPVGSQIGTLEFVLRFPPGFSGTSSFYGVYLVPLFNMVPPPNLTAVYGFALLPDASGEIVVSVGDDYRVHARATNIYSLVEFVRQSLTVWGVPADPSHNAQRGSEFDCEQFGSNEHFVPGEESCNAKGGFAANENPVAYLVNPTQCTEKPLTAELLGVESWEGEQVPPTTTNIGPFTGCESLKFSPTIAVAPEQTQATTPTGYEVDLKIPQTEGAEGLATPDLKDAVVKMPLGVVLSPSAANGLESCTEAQVGLGSEQPVECPGASKLGTASVITPALTGELKGALYLGGPPSGPITGPPFTVYLTFAGHGVLVKIRGTATPNPATDQITTVFDENPELPFSELKLHLTGGSRATLANPSTCGSYAAEGVLTPWSTPFTPDAITSSAPFEITGCQAPRFDPSFAASTLSNQAGGYSPLRVTFGREDADEDLGGLSVTTPPGLSGNLSKISLCSEPQAALGTCPEASQIGEVMAGAGPGPEPYFIKGGKVFITGPYDGAPFGLSIDVSERAGPLDLGSGPCDCEVVRATVSVNPRTAQLTVTNAALPTGKYGIPFQVKSVDVEINRPEFVFNPTNCEPLSVYGKLTSTQGMTSEQAYHFQVTNCAALAFKPAFKVSTSGKTTREDGASLDARLSYPKAPFGSQANIALAKVQLPKQLPSRLTTLQKACPAAVFEANPAACPAASRVGVARATTPIIPVPLTGPAYFVSHGGEGFPSLIVVLQGYGVTVDLVGSTFINEKTSVTTSTFKTVPDVPVGTFELYLPQGRYSALAAHGSLCNSKLSMPTEFVAQNGDSIVETTPISVTGCPKRKAVAVRARRSSRRRARR